MATDFRNWQLLSSGIIDPTTPKVIDTAYDAAFEVFKLFIFDCSLANHLGNDTLIMRIQDDSHTLVYNNRETFAGACLLSSVSGTLQSNLSLEIAIYINSTSCDQARPCIISGTSYYKDNGGVLQVYPIFCIYGPQLPMINPNPFLTLQFVSGNLFGFQGARWILYGVSSRGAAQLATSTSGG